MIAYVIFLVIIVMILYLHGTRTYNYWKEKGIKHDMTIPYFGNNIKQFFRKATIGMLAAEIYKKYPEEKVVGFYRGTNPELIIRDPSIAKRILVTDFEYFHARGFQFHEINIEPLLRNLLLADGDLWRLLNQCFAPAFSITKLKSMFPIITQTVKKLQVAAEDISNEAFYDMKELMCRYYIDFTGVCAFGINIDCLDDETSQFRKFTKRVVQRTWRDAVVIIFKAIFPKLCKNLTYISPKVESEAFNLIQAALKERNYKPSGRNDFIDILLDIKQARGLVKAHSIDYKNADGTPKVVELELDDWVIAAQVMIFFAAGFETSSTTASYMLHQFAFYPQCQRKAQAEIDRVLRKYDNEFTYDAIKEMKYLELAFYEAVRMYPSGGQLVRSCTTSKYTIPEINLTIDKGTQIVIPIKALHMDPKYFNNSEEFNPERFTSGTDISDFTYMPFGRGPRTCVGARLGLLQVVAGCAAILHRFSVEPAACSQQNPEPSTTDIIFEGFANGLPLKLRKRDCV